MKHNNKPGLNIRSLRLASCALALTGMTATAHAQSPTNVQLNEVTIKSERVVNRIDGLTIYPDRLIKESSSTGYSFLQKLSLPYLRIDESAHSVTAIDNKGEVQIRINGILADFTEMLSLDPKDIRKVDFIDHPGVRYGQGVAYVIDISTQRRIGGYTIGTDLQHALTTFNGDGTVYGKWHKRHDEWSLSYHADYNHSKGHRMEETTHYHLNDGSIYTVQRTGLAAKSVSDSQFLKLNYNRTKENDYTIQIALSQNWEHQPISRTQTRIEDYKQTAIATRQCQEQNFNPTLDIYADKQFSPNQSLVFNAIGTYINTSSEQSYDEGRLYQYKVKGKTYSFISEGIYEHRFKHLTYSAGFNFKQKYTQNLYSGDTEAHNHTHNTRLYLFTDFTGKWNKFGYSAGLGVSGIRYRQDQHQYHHWTFCPKLILTYNFTPALQASYSFDCHDRASHIAMTSQVSIQNNPMEWTVGSPELRPATDLEHTLRLSYHTPRLQTFVQGYYKTCHHPNMALYERTDDDLFIYTQTNQRKIAALQAMAYANYWVLPRKLSISAYGGLFRCFNFGHHYTHHYTSYFVNASANAYLGDFTLSAVFDNGSRFLEGETQGLNGSFHCWKASYQYKNWDFAISYRQPFIHKHKIFESKVLNKNLQKQSTLYSTDAANYVELHLTWRLNRGTKYRSPERTLHLKDHDTGIIKP